jgi:hypothetical protein
MKNLKTFIHQAAIIAACILLLFNNVNAQTSAFISAMPRSNHLNTYSGRHPSSFQYQQMPISMNYIIGIEQAITSSFSAQLGLMQNNQKYASKIYTGSNFDTDQYGYGSESSRNLPLELFLNLKQVLYRKNTFDVFLCAGANYVLEKPQHLQLITTSRFKLDENNNRVDTVLTNRELIGRHPDFRPFAAHAQLGVSKRFKNELTVSAAAFFYYAPPVYRIENTIRWENNTYQSRSELLGYFGALNLSVSYPIIRNKLHLLKKK